MERVLFWGAGAIGGSVAAFLARAGHDVTAVDASAEHVAAIKKHGIRLVGPIAAFDQPLKICVPEELEGQWDIIVLSVKAQLTAVACQQLLPHLSEKGAVISLQNGLCENVIAEQVGTERTVGAIVGFARDVLSAGEIRVGGGEKFSIGELDGSVSPRITALAKIFADARPPAKISTNIWGDLWGKMGFAGLLYGSALGKSPMADVWGRADLLPVWRALVAEILETARSQGITPVQVHGLMPENFQPGATEEAARANMAHMVEFLAGAEKPHSGMWRDVAIYKRKTEADEQIAPILELAAAHQVATPALAAFYELFKEVENQRVPQDDKLIADLIPAALQSPVNADIAGRN